MLALGQMIVCNVRLVQTTETFNLGPVCLIAIYRIAFRLSYYKTILWARRLSIADVCIITYQAIAFNYYVDPESGSNIELGT